jgi:PAS domain S-box-containing protein
VSYKLTREANFAIYYTSILLSIIATVLCVYHLRSVNNKVESQLILQRTFYENIFANLPADVAVFDKHHRYMYINPKGVRDNGLRKWLIGKDDFDYCERKNIDKTLAERRRNAFNRCIATHESVQLEEVNSDAKGLYTYHLRNYNPIIDEKGQVNNVIGYGIDITEQKQAQLKILEAKQLAENASRAKSNFLSNISHEIRTPLNAIIGLSNLLISDNKRENLEENLKIISYSANNLLALINDILDLSKIEEGKITAEKTPFSISELLSTLEKTIRIRSDEKKLDLITIFPEKLPPVLTGDPLRLNQILLNLCTNAVKFTEEGSVTIKVEVADKSADSISLLFEVRDTGIGISPQKIESIFDSFTQAESYTTRKYGGTGLGLNISKKLCEILGGEIRVESKVNLGSTFFVRLPFGYSHDTELLKSNSNTQNIKDLSHLKILMAEDNLINQRLAQQLFSKWNCQLHIVSSGRKALDELRKEKFDILLMDLQMPDMDGLTALQLLRTGEVGEANKDIPAIALTADVFEETRKKVYESGFNDFLSKPFNNEDLYRKITQRTNPV